MLKTVVRPVFRAAAALALGVGLVCANMPLYARQTPAVDPMDAVSLQELPSQARTTYRLILKGGPFPYDKDGTVFGNRERLLPLYQRGYYREYTVKTPWSRDRGARRIVCGGTPPTQPEACYYTSDHYNSFRKITP